MFFDFLRIMFACARPAPIIARDKVVVPGLMGGVLVVNTACTADRGLETAVLDREWAHPVENYKTEEEARAGHAVWVERMKTNPLITKLGYGEHILPEPILCVPMTEQEYEIGEQRLQETTVRRDGKE